MRLFVGLGNPGSEHAFNRHNIGFIVVDAIARHHSFSPWRRRFQGEFAEGMIGRHRVTLLKPQTYMNDSGLSVYELFRNTELSEDQVVVFHDELELALGSVRIKVGGGIAGHNGLRSISSHVGNEYRRVRLGIGHPRDTLGKDHPQLKDYVYRYVLSDFAKFEWPVVEELCDVIARHVDLLLSNHDASFLNKIQIGLETKGLLNKKPPGRGAR
ncbi:aminoacyl-tRNA hydrolase [Bradyrhizobium diazoefficiens]|nr:aminoacyl-tRNA hydrolase [Bradyrhizobium diazoefficiens]MBR0810525.1 aminoacyl-tRNA hydrolase [Bradyrhizobium diazoefficiens]